VQSHEADDDGTVDRTIYEMYYPELVATFTGNLLADIMLYPLETILYRLYLQVIVWPRILSTGCICDHVSTLIYSYIYIYLIWYDVMVQHVLKSWECST